MFTATLFLTTLIFTQGNLSDPVREFVHHYVESDPERIYSARFLGVPAIQNPADLWTFQEILTEVQPDYVVECGTAYGGTALFLASVLEEVNPHGRVITIDLKPGLEGAVSRLKDQIYLHRRVSKLVRDRVEVIRSDTLAPELLARLRGRLAGKKVLVTLDSCHHFQHVLKEMESYAPLVSTGSYLVVQDTIIDQRPEWLERFGRCPGYEGEGGPGRAVREFLSKNSDFQVDQSREKFLLTFHPSGYLKRIR